MVSAHVFRILSDLILAYTQSVGDPVDVIEPGSDQSDLQNAAIVKSYSPKPFVIIRGDPGRVARDLLNIGQHRALLIRDGRRPVVRLERANQFLIQSYPTQKLCVRLDSIMAPVQHRHHRRNHLVLPARKRQVW